MGPSHEVGSSRSRSQAWEREKLLTEIDGGRAAVRAGSEVLADEGRAGTTGWSFESQGLSTIWTLKSNPKLTNVAGLEADRIVPRKHTGWHGFKS